MTQTTEARELRDLLAAVLDALTLPHDVDDYQQRLTNRAGWAHTVIKAVVDSDREDVGWNADFLRSKLTAEQADAEPDGYAPVPTPGGDQHCPAAHPADPTPCVGLVAVTVLDAANAGANGCEHHAARLLASLEGGRVYALGTAPESAAIRVFKAAAALRPFPWLTNAPRVLPPQLSHEENRLRGEDR